jgi:hypothetical protein
MGFMRRRRRWWWRRLEFDVDHYSYLEYGDVDLMFSILICGERGVHCCLDISLNYPLHKCC